jgi:hypothetical protein
MTMLVASSEKTRDSVPFAETAQGRRDDTQFSRRQWPHRVCKSRERTLPAAGRLRMTASLTRERAVNWTGGRTVYSWSSF